METSDDAGDGKLSRRRFIKMAGGSLAAGTAAVALRNAAAAITKPHASPDSRAAESKAARAGALPSILGPTTPDPAALPGEQAFSIFWITDTQFLSESNPALFRMMNNWIVENWARFNGKLVIHTGDVVEHGPLEPEWYNADEAMSILLEKNIPYTWSAGNHDDLVEGDATSGWKGSALAASLDPMIVSARVNALPYARWAGDYHQGMNTAVSFSANDLNFLVINIEWNAQADVLQWVEGLLEDPAYADHRVIVAPHAYVDASGSLDNQRWGAQLADFLAALTSLIDQHSSSVFLTLNGHFASECGYNTPQPINNRNQLMFDRQDCADAPTDLTGRGVDEPPLNDTDKVGGATVMVLTFDTVNNRIRARTFDVYLGKWRTHSTEQYAVAMFPDVVPKLNAVTQ
ncbi:MAG TPA: metallophosphoesterase [Nitrososphaerales archaeon]|nr:metallophosphoesterase [Nitrososphaerales archaeon]